jgi:hypothetical protein
MSKFNNIVEKQKSFLKTKSLSDMAVESGSDKGPNVHNYTVLYEKIFEPKRYNKINILEIGLCRFDGNTEDAHSLVIWEEYFPHANIYGFDIRDFSNFKQERTCIIQGDQSNRSDLKKIVNKCDNFDIIIDDGGHIAKQQQISLGFLFPYLKSGGVYVIEDIGWLPKCDRKGKTKITTLKLFNNYISGGLIETDLMDEEEQTYLNENIASLIVEKPGDCEIGIIFKK